MDKIAYCNRNTNFLQMAKLTVTITCSALEKSRLDPCIREKPVGHLVWQLLNTLMTSYYALV